jgi:transcriptional regulator with GAF, ATPase, and Fis domain
LAGRNPIVEFLDALSHLRWTGNVRELRNLIITVLDDKTDRGDPVRHAATLSVEHAVRRQQAALTVGQ